MHLNVFIASKLFKLFVHVCIFMCAALSDAFRGHICLRGDERHHYTNTLMQCATH